MKSVIIKPRNKILKSYIQYFLFFKKTDYNSLNYITFPNNNLCLAIYKDNNVDYNKLSSQNSCRITQGSKSFTSRFYGFHKEPFNVDINSHLDQICILFYPSALRVFTHESYNELMSSDNVFDIFTTKDDSILEQIFEENDISERANKLEYLLLSNLNYEVPQKVREALYLISKYKDDNFTVEMLAQKLEISMPTLFRLFQNHIGQSSKSYLKTVRFRNVLNQILNTQNTLTNIAHSNQYFDQAHFINDFKSLSGYSPRQFFQNVSVLQNDLSWIYNKKQV
jgi:YesN/AraC family two-component response regulator